MGSIIYDIRLPPDPPRAFDISRVTLALIYNAIKQPDISLALTPICRAVGLADYSVITNWTNQSDWKTAYERSRADFLIKWLVEEDRKRGGNIYLAGAPQPVKK